jgi:hypothetical protein
MNPALIKENNVKWLHEVAPSFKALLQYLRKENNGANIHEVKNYYSIKYGREVYEMSDGLTYSKNDSGKWCIINNTGH